jgi:hypothetical protein
MAANDIARETWRGAGNGIVITPALHKIIHSFLTEHSGTNIFKSPNPDLASYTGLSHLGTLNGMMELFVNDKHEGDDASALISYRGVSDIDTGYLLNPYVLVMGSGMVTVDGCERMSTMCRFGELSDEVGPTYYRKLTFNV